MDRIEKIRRALWRKSGPFAYAWEKLKRNLGVKKRDPWEGKKCIFIVSTGRTATKFFARFFSERFDAVHAVHEPPLDIFPVAVAYFRGKISYQKARFLFDYYRKRILKEMERNGTSIYIESNPRLAFMLPIIKNIGQDHHIIHIVRDCRSYVRSGYSKETTIGGQKVKVRSEADSRKRITAQDFPDDPYGKKWDEMSRFERNCWFWQKKDRLIQNELIDEPNAHTFFYEDLFSSLNADKTWRDLIDVLELKGLEKNATSIQDFLKSNVENQNPHYELGAWEDWPMEYKEKLIEIAGDHMKELGYELK